ncbi:MAG: capsular biosynthesis protein, partial [Cloacibacterium sp.]|nr:capsular biosynthesis protein [Cloacibacterium sp.]
MNNNNFQEEEIHINELIRPYMKRWKWFVLSGFFALVVSYFFLKTQNPVYETVSTVLIKDAKNSFGGQDFEMLRDLSGLGKMSSDGVDNEIEVFKSKKLMTKVIKDLGLETDIYVSGFFKDTEVYGKTSPIIVKIISEKETTKPVEPIHVTMNGDKLILNSDDIGIINSSFDKLISLK